MFAVWWRKRRYIVCESETQFNFLCIFPNNSFEMLRNNTNYVNFRWIKCGLLKLLRMETLPGALCGPRSAACPCSWWLCCTDGRKLEKKAGTITRINADGHSLRSFRGGGVKVNKCIISIVYKELEEGALFRLHLELMRQQDSLFISFEKGGN